MPIINPDQDTTASGSGVVDNTTEGSVPIKKSGAFENSSISENELQVLSVKPVIASNLKSGMDGDVGSLSLGAAVTMSVGGEFAYLKDSITGGVARNLVQGVGDSPTLIPISTSLSNDVVIQAINTDTVTAPTFKITPTDNLQIIAISIDALSSVDNVVIKAYKNGVEFYKNNVGLVPSGAIHKINLLEGEGVPLDLFKGVEYEIEIKSTTDNISLKGVVVTPVTEETPFYALDYYGFDLQPIITTKPSVSRQKILSQSSTKNNQQPTALDTPVIIEFGEAFGDSSDPIKLDDEGLFTVNESGSYFLKPFVHYGRTTSQGEVELFFRMILNGIQYGNSVFARLDDDDTVIPSSVETEIQLSAGDVFHYELIRDSANGGINNGGIFTGRPTPLGWNDAPCAAITISRLVVDMGV